MEQRIYLSVVGNYSSVTHRLMTIGFVKAAANCATPVPGPI
jgi:hypothetical protein